MMDLRFLLMLRRMKKRLMVRESGQRLWMSCPRRAEALTLDERGCWCSRDLDFGRGDEPVCRTVVCTVCAGACLKLNDGHLLLHFRSSSVGLKDVLA